MSDKTAKNYDDIIDHPHYRSKTRQPMSLRNRAAQFAPFAALTGYGESVINTEKQVEADVMNEIIHEKFEDDWGDGNL